MQQTTITSKNSRKMAIRRMNITRDVLIPTFYNLVSVSR